MKPGSVHALDAQVGKQVAGDEVRKNGPFFSRAETPANQARNYSATIRSRPEAVRRVAPKRPDSEPALSSFRFYEAVCRSPGLSVGFEPQGEHGVTLAGTPDRHERMTIVFSS